MTVDGQEVIAGHVRPRFILTLLNEVFIFFSAVMVSTVLNPRIMSIEQLKTYMKSETLYGLKNKI